MKNFINSIIAWFTNIWLAIWEKIEVPYYGLISSSWFYQHRNKKVTKLEVYYVVMSIATFFVFWGGTNDYIRGQEFSTAYYILITPFCIAWILKAITIFGYTATKRVQEIYWKTQLFRWLDPSGALQFSKYPEAAIKLKTYKERWEVEYDVPVKWTVANAPFFMVIQITLIIGSALLGFLVGYFL